MEGFSLNNHDDFSQAEKIALIVASSEKKRIKLD